MLQLPNVDRDPIPRWSFGRVTLIGDAAHPMQPVGAQAGSQAVVDGRVLAASLMAVRDPVEALTRYQDQRIAAMNDMIIRNRNLGLESILQTAEERAPGGFKHIHDVLSQEELETHRRSASRRRRASTSRPSTAAIRSWSRPPSEAANQLPGLIVMHGNPGGPGSLCIALTGLAIMGIRQKLDTKRLLNGALLLGAIALAWAIERPRKPAPPVLETYPTGWTVDPQAYPPPAGILRMRWPWWRAVLLDTYEAMSKDRLLAVAAGVVFYATARDLSGHHGVRVVLWPVRQRERDPGQPVDARQRAAGRRHLDHRRSRSPASPRSRAGSASASPSASLIALWSANAGVKAMIDALNVIEGRTSAAASCGSICCR